MKFGICNEIFKGWSWEKTVDYVSGAGYDGIEIAPFTLAESVDSIPKKRREEIRGRAGANNLEIIGLHWLLASPEGLSLSTPDAGVRRKTADYLRKLIFFCSDIGGRFLILGSPEQRRIHPGKTCDQTYDYVKNIISAVLTPADDRGVSILIEPLGRAETNFINTSDEAVKFIEDINHPRLGLHLDAKAMSDEEKSIPEIIKASKSHLMHFHANDPNLRGPGSGELDYLPVRDALDEIGYNGWISVEVFDFTPGAESIAGESLAYLKSVFST